MKYPVRKSLTVFALLASTWPLSAQTTAPAPAKPEKEEEVVVLSPFEVSGTKDTGYQATETLAGTRIRTDLRDVGSAISVVTKEFMKDVGATDSSTLLQYTTNAEVAGTRGTYTGLGNGANVDETANLRAPAGAQRVRGLAAADNTRDFFVTDIPWDSYNVERIDIQRGPNSILFGLGSPAGIVNASTNSAIYSNKGSIEYRFGSYGSQRASLDVNQVLIDKVLAIRVDGLFNRERYQQNPAFQNDKRVSGAIRFEPKLFRDPSFRTSIKIKYEHGDIQANRPRVIPPYDSITPYFTPLAQGGMGRQLVPNGYTLGAAQTTFSPWLGGLVNQQQPLWFIDGSNNQLQRIYGGYVNTGALNAAGVPQGASTSIIGQRYSDVFSQITNYSSYARNANLPGANSGQYRDIVLMDPTIFDFYNTLIDGPTKKEWEKWNAYNIDLSQTAYGDRLGVQLSYDRQKYERGGQALLNNSPTLNLDILQNFQDYVVGPTNAANPNVANGNLLRPYVAAGPGRGNSYTSDRQYFRGSVFGELRASDFTKSDFLRKLLGKHRFNGVYSDEKYLTENRSWQMYANSSAYASMKLQGNPDGLTNLPPVAVVYLGSSLANRTSAAGAAIPGIQSAVTLNDGNIYQFQTTWNNPTGVSFGTPWNVPAGPLSQTLSAAQIAALPAGINPLQAIFNGVPVLTQTGGANPQLTEVSNPANYVGWNSNFNNILVRYDDGKDESMITARAKSLRVTKSYAGSWQGFLWNDAIVPTLGWRYDEVTSKGVTAVPLPAAAARGALNFSDQPVYASDGTLAQPLSYRFPDGVPNVKDTNKSFAVFKDHSVAGGVVVHVNKLFGDKDPLPFNISLSYNKSSNFSVVDRRRDIYGNTHPSPTGETKDYGILLATKDGKYSLRAVKFETNMTGVNTPLQLSTSGGSLTGTIVDALNWRNIKTYYMSAYAWSTAGQTNLNHYSGQRYLWDAVWVNNATGRPVAAGNAALPSGLPPSHLETQAEADIRRDASLKAINDMQIFLASKGYFDAWNYGAGPTTQTALQTRGQYETSPILPNPASVYDYRTAPAMQGFAVTSDASSRGYEFEFTANPTASWRISFNASQTQAIRTNVGGPVLDELVAYMDTLMAGPAGDLVRFNSDYSTGNELRANWNGWRNNYTLLKLQQGAAAPEIRKWRYNVVTNYSFRNGMLKGMGVGGSYRWQDKVVIGYPVTANSLGQATFDLTKPYYGPSEDAIDLWISYERRISSKLNWKIQLNVRNAGDKNKLIPISVQPDGQTWASARIAPQQEWFVTNTFSF